MFHPEAPPPWGRHGVKRKTLLTPDTVPVEPPPEKHFITEEIMAAEMRRLQIEEQIRTSPYLYQIPAPFTFNTAGQFSGFGPQPEQNGVESVEMTEKESEPRLVLSEEIMKIKPQPLVPPSLISSLPTSQMALVPYVPRHLIFKGEEEKKDAMDVV